jgi:serine/threonine-protein kinase
LLAGAATALLLGALGWWFAQRGNRPALADDLVAVAPFDVLDPALAVWSEGMVDVLARNLDGAGPLRTVAPTSVIRRWRGRADRSSAAALGSASGATPSGPWRPCTTWRPTGPSARWRSATWAPAWTV